MDHKIRLAIHGGAGDLAPGHPDPAEHRQALHDIAAEGLRLLAAGASALDAVERMVVALEECPLFNAGVGAVLNREGQPELDAAIMDGRNRTCGAVAGVSHIKHPIRLARAVMEKSPHVMFMGVGAEAFGRELGLREVTPDYFITEERFHQFKEARGRGLIAPDPDSDLGTVGAVARDAQGNLAAATSTGGLSHKHPGRIGDTPVIGAGTFADNRSAAVSCTGTGESFIRVGFGHHVHGRMTFSSWDLNRACAEGLEAVQKLGGRGGCIAIDHDGNLALPFNSRQMYRAWVGADGTVRVAVHADERE